MADPGSILRRSSAAFVIVDVQERLAAAMDRRSDVIERTSFLARVAALVGMPVILTRQYPRGLGDIEPLVTQAVSPAEEISAPPVVVDKLAFDCFNEPEFVSALEATGADQLLVAGMETHICVTQTALSALRRGLDVHVCADACCSRDVSLHHLALGRLGRAGAVVTCAESAAYELIGVAGTDEFKALLAAVKG